MYFCQRRFFRHTIFFGPIRTNTFVVRRKQKKPQTFEETGLLAWTLYQDSLKNLNLAGQSRNSIQYVGHSATELRQLACSHFLASIDSAMLAQTSTKASKSTSLPGFWSKLLRVWSRCKSLIWPHTRRYRLPNATDAMASSIGNGTEVIGQIGRNAFHRYPQRSHMLS